MKHIFNRTNRDYGRKPSPSAGFSRSKAIEVLVGSMLGRLTVFTDQEWADLEEVARPHDCVYAPGLGWVCVVATANMN
jgi:hypothetical protein